MFPINPDDIPTHRLQRAIDTLKGSMDKLEKAIAPDASAKLPPVRPTPAPEQAAAASKITSDILAMLDSNPDPDRELSGPEIQMRAMKVAKYLDDCSAIMNVDKCSAVQIIFVAGAMHFLKHNTMVDDKLKSMMFDKKTFMSMGRNAMSAAGLSMEKYLCENGHMPDDVPADFDPKTDPDRPVIGEKLKWDSKNYVIAGYKHYTLREMLEAKENGTLEELLDKGFHDLGISRNHATIRGLMWNVYLDEVQ